MSTKRNYTYYYIVTMCALALLTAFAACERDAHEGERGLAVALDNSRCADVPIGSIKLCLYDTGGNLTAAYDYADAHGIAAALIPVEAGHYTVAAIVNADKELTATATLTALHEWLVAEAGTDTDLLTGMAEADVAEEGITRVTVPLQQGAFALPVLRLWLTLPEPRLPDYSPATVKSRAAEAGYVLRCVAELCKAGSDNAVLHKAAAPTLQADGETYLVELSVPEGTYDLRLWTDYTRTDTPLADTYYHTESLKAVAITTEPYTANTDAKDAAYHSESGIALPEAGADVAVRMERPLAKYRIIADDVEMYRKLSAANPEKYPPMEELAVTVQYEDFFPSEFNTGNSKVTDSTTGLGFAAKLTDTDADELPVAADWVMASGESVVTATLTVSDGGGRQICRVSGVSIAYKQGCMTTIKGKFLTAGISSGGISIDNDWHEIIIEF